MPDISPEQQTDLLWDYIKGFHAVHLINAGLQLGLFAEIDNHEAGITAAALAETLDLHPRYVGVWCNTAYAYALLEGDGHNFTLAPHMDSLLVDRRNPRYLAPYAEAAAGFFTDDFRRYPDFFKSGETFTFQDHGRDFSNHVAAMTSGFHTVIARKMLPSVDGIAAALEAGGRVLDVGCGAGRLLVQIAKAFPQAQCSGVDIDDHGVALARETVADAGLADRIEIEKIGGQTMPHQDAFDVVTMIEVLHEIEAAHRPAVLANCAQALKPGGVLFILDETYPSEPAQLRERKYNLAVQTAFNELIWGNIVPTAAEQDALLTDAGFGSIQRTQVATYFTLLTARKAA